VEGQDDLLVYRARCCNPIRGEEIVGYVTRGKGVAVHARSCPNVQNLLYESDRRISVEWARMVEENAGRKMTYPVKLTVFCDDRAGMLKEMTAVISDDGTNIRGVDSKSTGDSEAVVEFVLEAEDMRHLTRLVSGLRRVPGRARRATRAQGQICVPFASLGRRQLWHEPSQVSGFHRKCASGHRPLFPGGANRGIWSTPPGRLRSIRQTGQLVEGG
jgi:hypothetical protein